MILLIDNYDSFSYNLYQYIGEIDPEIKVIRNDELPLSGIEQLDFNRIVISPGPGRPSAAGVCKEVIRQYVGRVPILGVCLGHQAICEVFGATVSYAKELMHGKASTIPSVLRVIARTADGEIMAVQYDGFPVFGLQFHPESILTPDGKTILKNFMRLTS